MNINREEVFKRIEDLRISGLTWFECAEVLNEELGLNFTESTYRKPYNAYKIGQASRVEELELVEKLRKIELEKKKLSIKRGAYQEELRDKALEELYREDIKEAIKNLPEFKFPIRVPLKGQGKNTHVITLGDLHYDGNFNLEEVLGDVLSKIAIYCDENKDIQKLIIIELGDNIEGSSLRPSQMRAIKLGMVDQMIHVSEAYANFLVELFKRTKLKIDFHTVTESNHTQIRPLNTKRNELPDEDLLKTFARYLEARLQNVEEISINYGGDLFINLHNMNIVASHGHKYDISPNRLATAAESFGNYYKRKIDHRLPTYYIFGHWHQYRETLLEEYRNSRDKAFLVPALSPMKSSYERLGLMGSNPAFAIFKFDEYGKHLYTQTINTISYE